MEFSLFGQKFAKKSGILELMDDLGRALGGSERKIMLGGGNPAAIPEVNLVWRRRLSEIMAKEGELEALLSHYDTPQGKPRFLDTFAAMLRNNFGWSVSAENIVITNGSQNGFFLLFNLLAGEFPFGQKKKILFPLAPEYIGYADQALGLDHFRSHRPQIVEEDFPFFKYHVDFHDLEIGKDIGALCASRPTNPTGNVLTNEEVSRLSKIAREKDIPFILDNAYGSPFPRILFEDIEPYWDEHTILSMSLSKLGLPAARTGILVAPESVVEAISSANAVLNLANSGIGQAITLPMLENGFLFELSKAVIQPYYKKKKDFALGQAREIFGDRFEYRIHKPEGALFLWFWFPQLKISTKELYQRLKGRHVIVVPGEYFFFGMDHENEKWDHRRQCIRVNYARDENEVLEGLRIVAEEVEKAQDI